MILYLSFLYYGSILACYVVTIWRASLSLYQAELHKSWDQRRFFKVWLMLARHGRSLVAASCHQPPLAGNFHHHHQYRSAWKSHRIHTLRVITTCSVARLTLMVSPTGISTPWLRFYLSSRGLGGDDEVPRDDAEMKPGNYYVDNSCTFLGLLIYNRDFFLHRWPLPISSTNTSRELLSQFIHERSNETVNAS